MNKFDIIFLASLVVVLGASVNAYYYYYDPIAEAQKGSAIEGYTEADKQVKFQRLQFEFYVLARDIGDGDNFITGIEGQRANKVLKSLPLKTNLALWAKSMLSAPKAHC